MADRYKLLWLTMFLSIYIVACKNEKVAAPTHAQQQAKLDSIISVMQEEVRISEEENLRDRMSIELKIRVDSILKAKEKLAPKQPIIANQINDSLTLSDTTIQ